MLIIVSGSSGVGKNTVINRLLQEDETLELLTTVTTRDMRPGESQWNPYYFVSEEEFRGMLERGEMLEFCEVHKGILYGTNRKILEEKEQLGKVLIKDIDVDGTVALKQVLSDLVTIYLTVPREVLRERLIGRGEAQIDLRLKRYDYEESKKEHYDYVIENNDLEVTVQKIRDIIRNAVK